MKTFEWSNLWNDFGMKRDNGNRLDVTKNTPNSVKEYLASYRAPSRAWLNSYAKALLTGKFYNWLAISDVELFNRITTKG